MLASRCSHCGGRTEPVSETWESGGRLLHVERCVSCGRETALESTWPGQRPPSASASGRRRAAGALWLGAALATLWITLRVIDYTSRASVYGRVADALEGFRSPVWIGLIVLLTTAAVWRARRRRVASVAGVLVEHVQLRVSGDDALAVSVAEGHDAVGQEHEVERDRNREARILDEFIRLGRRASRGDQPGDSDATREEIRRKLLAIGRDLGALMGAGAQPARAILASRASHMLLRVPSEIAGLPWELAVLRDGSGPLWQLFAMARQAVVPVSGSRRTRDVRLPLRVLLLADLESDAPGRALPEASREASEIMELGAQRPDVLRIVRRTPRTLAELDELLGEGFDIIHFAGHGTRATGGAAAWSLADGSAAPTELRTLADPPVLVFSNACVPTGEDGGMGGALAEAFLAWGAGAYIGPFWDLSDRGGAVFARAFYAALADGATLGDAIQRARSSAAAASSVTWAGYVLYGDPTKAPARAVSARR